jgi:chromosome segregation ATPase
MLLQELKSNVNAREQENNALLQQVADLQAELEQKKALQAQDEAASADKSRMEEEIMGLKSERNELSMQTAHLQSEVERLDTANSNSTVEVARLRAALESVDNEIVQQSEQWKEEARELTKKHVDTMDARNKRAAKELDELSEQWRADVAAREVRIQEIESAGANLQKEVRRFLAHARAFLLRSARSVSDSVGLLSHERLLCSAYAAV